MTEIRKGMHTTDAALPTVPPPPVSPPMNEVRVVLSREDFVTLIRGQEVAQKTTAALRPGISWKGARATVTVKVILSDIGFTVMRDELDRAIRGVPPQG
jgi:hypothetical protein